MISSDEMYRHAVLTSPKFWELRDNLYCAMHWAKTDTDNGDDAKHDNEWRIALASLALIEFVQEASPDASTKLLKELKRRIAAFAKENAC